MIFAWKSALALSVRLPYRQVSMVFSNFSVSGAFKRSLGEPCWHMCRVTQCQEMVATYGMLTDPLKGSWGTQGS